jgi:hypothetical protein
MCRGIFITFTLCLCEYDQWQTCEMAELSQARLTAEPSSVRKVVLEWQREKAAENATIAPKCIKNLDDTRDTRRGSCWRCKEGKDPMKPGDVGEGKTMPGRKGKRQMLDDRWLGGLKLLAD